MARRRGKPGEWIAADDYTGFTQYASTLKLDYWGARTQKPLLRNLQEIASPLDDPEPVPFFRGPDYESSDFCGGRQVAPRYIGETTVPTNIYNAAIQGLDLIPGIGNMMIGCSFVVSEGTAPDPDPVPPMGYLFLIDADGDYLTDPDGAYLIEAI